MQSKTYVVVGGSSGIGLEITRELSRKGHQVVVCSRTKGGLEGLAGVTHEPCDVVNDPLSADTLPEPLDGLVYCPGSIRLRPFRSLKAQDFIDDFQVNLLGAVKSVQACLAALKKAEAGASIVLFSTVAAQTGMPYHTSIASAKGAVEGLTRSLAAELAPRIRVNAIAPSLTATPMARMLIDSEAKQKAAGNRHPLQRIGTPGEIASTACHLLGAGGSWITGQILHVDGGMGALRTFK